MIADGVHQGYLEVRLMMASKRGSLPTRPWRMADTPRDWVKEIAAIAQRPGAQGLAPIASASPDGPMAGGVEALRQAIADSRREAVERSRARPD